MTYVCMYAYIRMYVCIPALCPLTLAESLHHHTNKHVTLARYAPLVAYRMCFLYTMFSIYNVFSTELMGACKCHTRTHTHVNVYILHIHMHVHAHIHRHRASERESAIEARALACCSARFTSGRRSLSV